jgi:hypothetical protein
MKENRTAHGVIDPNKTGPRPKELVEKTVLGIAVGRDKTVVPPDQVYELAAIGCTDGEIGRFFGIKEDTLRYNFAAELAKAREYVKIRLRRNMFKAADNLQPAILIFLSKNLLGYTDQPISSESNSPLPWTETDDVEIEELTDEET